MSCKYTLTEIYQNLLLPFYSRYQAITTVHMNNHILFIKFAIDCFSIVKTSRWY